MGRRLQMKEAGALCYRCRSCDVRFNGRCPIKSDKRPHFLCGSCGIGWTSGTDGKPYSDFVKIENWYNKYLLEDLDPKYKATLEGGYNENEC